VTYSYTFPILAFVTQPDPNLVTYEFLNIEVNISNWHFFKFEKLIDGATFTITFPKENIEITKIFGKLY